LGKFPNSKIHDVFSKWHWEKCGRHAHLSDIDRIWIEVRNGKPLAAVDLKWDNGIDRSTPTELCLADWLLQNGVPWFTFYCREDFKVFDVEEHSTKLRKWFSDVDLAEWIDTNCQRAQGWR